MLLFLFSIYDILQPFKSHSDLRDELATSEDPIFALCRKQQE